MFIIANQFFFTLFRAENVGIILLAANNHID